MAQPPARRGRCGGRHSPAPATSGLSPPLQGLHLCLSLKAGPVARPPSPPPRAAPSLFLQGLWTTKILPASTRPRDVAKGGGTADGPWGSPALPGRGLTHVGCDDDERPQVRPPQVPGHVAEIGFEAPQQLCGAGLAPLDLLPGGPGGWGQKGAARLDDVLFRQTDRQAALSSRAASPREPD